MARNRIRESRDRTVAFLALAAAAFLLLRGGAYAAEAGPAPEAAACPTDTIRRIALDRSAAVREIPKAPAYTQGLVVVDGQLYESTGKKGHSGVYRLDASGGPRAELLTLNESLFGEGLAKLGGRFYQLTWRSGLAFAYDYDAASRSFSRVTAFRLGGEGWGLTALAGELVLSDGSDTLFFIDPETFAVKRKVPVRLGTQPIAYLNELEFVRGEILANVYGRGIVYGIEPERGCVRTVIDAAGLVADVAKDLEALTAPVCVGRCSSWDFVLNGIAYDPDKDELYLTGKNWPIVFVYRGIAG